MDLDDALADELALASLDGEFVFKFVDKRNEIPAVPRRAVPATSDGEGLPKTAGIYFVWDESGNVAYVGKAECLANRCRIGKHCNILEGDWISWLRCSIKQIEFRESFYIGICRPSRNFGKSTIRHRLLARRQRRRNAKSPLLPP